MRSGKLPGSSTRGKERTILSLRVPRFSSLVASYSKIPRLAYVLHPLMGAVFSLQFLKCPVIDRCATARKELRLVLSRCTYIRRGALSADVTWVPPSFQPNEDARPSAISTGHECSKFIVYFLCLQQDLYLSVAIKFLTAEPALDVEELLGGFLS